LSECINSCTCASTHPHMQLRLIQTCISYYSCSTKLGNNRQIHEKHVTQEMCACWATRQILIPINDMDTHQKAGGFETIFSGFTSKQQKVLIHDVWGITYRDLCKSFWTQHIFEAKYVWQWWCLFRVRHSKCTGVKIQCSCIK